MHIKQLQERLALAYKIITSKDGNLVAHAQSEFALRSAEDAMDKMMESGVIDLLRTLSTQGHSGFSAGFARRLFSTLSAYEPLGPLTGADAEWFDHGDTMGAGTRWQNKRASNVFKAADGQAYDIDAVVFQEPSGSRFTGAGSRMPVSFPYTPRTVTAHIAHDASDEDRQTAASLAWAAA